MTHPSQESEMPETRKMSEAWGAMLEDIIGLWGGGEPDKDDVLETLSDHRPFIEEQAATEARRELLAKVEAYIFDLPIGDDVTYSRGYSAGIGAARDSFRRLIEEPR